MSSDIRYLASLLHLGCIRRQIRPAGKLHKAKDPSQHSSCQTQLQPSRYVLGIRSCSIDSFTFHGHNVPFLSWVAPSNCFSCSGSVVFVHTCMLTRDLHAVLQSNVLFLRTTIPMDTSTFLRSIGDFGCGGCTLANS